MNETIGLSDRQFMALLRDRGIGDIRRQAERAREMPDQTLPITAEALDALADTLERCVRIAEET